MLSRCESKRLKEQAENIITWRVWVPRHCRICRGELPG